MRITSHLVQNVIRNYSKQLQRSKLSAGSDVPDAERKRMPSANVSISEEAGRQMILQHFASQTKDLNESTYCEGNDQLTITLPIPVD